MILQPWVTEGGIRTFHRIFYLGIRTPSNPASSAHTYVQLIVRVRRPARSLCDFGDVPPVLFELIAGSGRLRGDNNRLRLLGAAVITLRQYCSVMDYVRL